MDYCLGFAFTPDHGKVALIRKAKPAWQAGFLNGIGGKIEPEDPSPAHAQVREFYEETGVSTFLEDWREVGKVLFGGHREDDPDRGTVYVFTIEHEFIEHVDTTTIEEVNLYDGLWVLMNDHELLPNVETLIYASMIRENEHGKRPYLELSYRS